MPLWHGKSKGNRLGYSIFVSVLRHLGIAPAYFLLRFVSLYYLLFSWKTNRSMYHYFNRRLGFRSWKKRRTRQRMIEEYGDPTAANLVGTPTLRR